VYNKEPHVEVYLNNQQILPVACQCILSLTNYSVNNQEYFQTNSSIHNTNISNKHHLHRPNANLSCFQKSIFYAGIKDFNSLPPSLTTFKNDKAKFKAALRKYLNTRFFYSVNELFMCKDNL